MEKDALKVRPSASTSPGAVDDLADLSVMAFGDDAPTPDEPPADLGDLADEPVFALVDDPWPSPPLGNQDAQRAEVDVFIVEQPEFVPRFVTHNGREAVGGQDWSGRRRMAEARAAAGVDLDDLDRQALDGGTTP